MQTLNVFGIPAHACIWVLMLVYIQCFTILADLLLL